ncbi:hypothetical protein KAR91_64215 [Candidatus Pacearchaeota archaeon]|nr:hypothetical protein [Candidatus Pacearchaeota archaeon]
MGRSCYVETVIKEYRDSSGKARRGNDITFSGFYPAVEKKDSGRSVEDDKDNDIPF